MGKGVGYKLKKRQREFAMRQGIRLVTWTFDPMLTANAHLNIRKLGAISTSYLEDYYGTSNEGGLSRTGTSDRLLVEWWVTNRRVEERLNGSRGLINLNQYLEADTPIANASSVNNAGLVIPSKSIVVPTGSLGLVEIPVTYESLIQSNLPLAVRWQGHIRDVMQGMLAHGYIITDFVRSTFENRDRAFYLFSQADKAFERVDFSHN